MNDMAGIIEVENLTKIFSTKDAEVEALQGINLSIQAGEIYGIIGMSGHAVYPFSQSLHQPLEDYEDHISSSSAAYGNQFHCILL